MKQQTILGVDKLTARLMERACNHGTKDRHDETIFDQEVVFPNGNRVAVQVVASSSPNETAWTQGVLFSPDGIELASTDVGESFLGEYFLYYENEEYVVDVVVVPVTITTQYTKLTRQNQNEAINKLAALPNDSGDVSIDVVDPQGEVGHINVYKDANGAIKAREHTPDPRNLYRRLTRPLRLDKLTLAVNQDN